MWNDLDDTEVVNHIRENIADYEYRFKIDVPVVVRDELVIAVECKAYADNTMLKRVLFDGYLIRRHSIRMPTLFAFNVRFQLESQLDGAILRYLQTRFLVLPAVVH